MKLSMFLLFLLSMNSMASSLDSCCWKLKQELEGAWTCGTQASMERKFSEQYNRDIVSTVLDGQGQSLLKGAEEVVSEGRYLEYGDLVCFAYPLENKKLKLVSLSTDAPVWPKTDEEEVKEEETALEDIEKKPKKSLEDKVKNMDFSSSEYVFKIGGSTSCNVHIYKKDPTDLKDGLKKVGKYVPENPAGNPNTEVAYFQLGELIGVKRVYEPAAPLVMRGGTEVQKFLKTLSKPKNYSKHKKNCQYLSSRVMKEGKVEGAFKKKKKGDKIDTKDYYSSSGLNLSKRVSRFLKQGNKMPGDSLMSLDSKYVPSEYKNEEKVLAYDLFHVLIGDVLFSQYDRWSGQNFVVRVKTAKKTGKKTVNFYAADNGGTYLINGYTLANLKGLKGNWFNRYYKQTMDSLVELESFLNGKSSGFEGLKTKAELAYALGLRFSKSNGVGAPERSPLKQLEVVKKNLGKLLAKYRQDLQKAEKSGKSEDLYLPKLK